jgi:peroxiredoxin
MTVRKILAWSVLAVGALAITYTWAPRRGQELLPVEKLQPATEFTLLDADGKKVNLSDYKGKVVLLNFWATWCGPCEVEIPWFIDFERTYKDQGFEVLGVSFDEEGWTTVKPYVAEHKMNYRVLMGKEDMPSVYWDLEAIPTTMLIDKEGRIAVTHRGLVSKPTYEAGIVTLLGS